MTDPKINLTELRDLLVASQPSTDLTMENGGPHFTDHALVSRQRLVAKLLNGALLALIDTAEAAIPVADEANAGEVTDGSLALLTDRIDRFTRE